MYSSRFGRGGGGADLRALLHRFRAFVAKAGLLMVLMVSLFGNIKHEADTIH